MRFQVLLFGLKMAMRDCAWSGDRHSRFLLSPFGFKGGNAELLHGPEFGLMMAVRDCACPVDRHVRSSLSPSGSRMVIEELCLVQIWSCEMFASAIRFKGERARLLPDSEMVMWDFTFFCQIQKWSCETCVRYRDGFVRSSLLPSGSRVAMRGLCPVQRWVM